MIGTGPDLNSATDNGLARAAELLDMSVPEVKNRATIAGAIEIGRLPGVVQVTFRAPADRLRGARPAGLRRRAVRGAPRTGPRAPPGGRAHERGEGPPAFGRLDRGDWVSRSRARSSASPARGRERPSSARRGSMCRTAWSIVSPGGRATVTGVLAGFPTVFVTTTGARSGRPHTVPLIAVTDEAKPGRIALVASNFGQSHDPAWCRNLRASPEADVDGERYTAEEVGGEAWERWFHLATAIYVGYPLYRSRAGTPHPDLRAEPRRPLLSEPRGGGGRAARSSNALCPERRVGTDRWVEHRVSGSRSRPSAATRDGVPDVLLRLS